MEKLEVGTVTNDKTWISQLEIYPVSLTLCWVCVRLFLHLLVTLTLPRLLWNLLLLSPFSGFLPPEWSYFFICLVADCLPHRKIRALPHSQFYLHPLKQQPAGDACIQELLWILLFYLRWECLPEDIFSWLSFYSALGWLQRPQSFWLYGNEAIKPYLNWNEFVFTHWKTNTPWGAGTHAAMWVLPIASTQPETKFLY